MVFRFGHLFPLLFLGPCGKREMIGILEGTFVFEGDVWLEGFGVFLFGRIWNSPNAHNARIQNAH